MRRVARSGDHQEAAASFLDERGQVLQVLLADLRVFRIHIAQDDDVEAVQLFLDREERNSAPVLRRIAVVSVKQQHLEVNRLVLLIAVSFAFEQVLDEAILVTGVTFDVEDLDQLGLADEDRAFEAIVVGRLDLVFLLGHGQHIGFFAWLRGLVDEAELDRLALAIRGDGFPG